MYNSINWAVYELHAFFSHPDQTARRKISAGSHAGGTSTSFNPTEVCDNCFRTGTVSIVFSRTHFVLFSFRFVKNQKTPREKAVAWFKYAKLR
jgi:hypothetical protein